MKEFEYYIFDFDGTLCDTTRGIFNSVKYALSCAGINETDEKKLGYFIGPPLFESFKTLYGVSDSDAEYLIAKYRERYKVTASVESELYPGIKELLCELKARGKKIAVASSKPKLFVDEISEYQGIAEFYDYTAAESFKNNHSSKKDLINEVCEFFGSPDKACVIMTGDRFYDIDGAKAAGVASAGAVYGFGTEDELTKAKTDFLLYSPDDLLKY